MNHLPALFLSFFFSFIIFSANAQATKNQDGNNIFQSSNLAIVIGVLSFIFITIILIFVYTNFFHAALPAILNFHLDVDGPTRSRSKLCGLDKTVIGSLPSFRFSSLKGCKAGLECAICISKFEDDEILRLLPNCKHAFHKNCIDEWLERKSSCPLCRYTLNAEEFSSFTHMNDFGIHHDPPNVIEDANFEIYIQRAQGSPLTTSMFNLGSGFKKFINAKKEVLIQEGDHYGDSTESGNVFLDKFKHKIIVSDIAYKRRWSDLNSSDLLCLSSEMLAITSSQRFSPSNDHIVRIEDSNSKSGSSSPCFSSFETSISMSSRSMLNPAEMRSLSETKTFPRFKEISIKNSNHESSGNYDERMRSLWFDIARRTVHGFASMQRRDSQYLEAESKRHLFDV